MGTGLQTAPAPAVGAVAGAAAMPDAEALELARRWCGEFLARPHPLIGRAGQVCPFVESVTRAGTLLVRTRRTTADESADDAALDRVVAEMERTFRTAAWAHRNRTLRALLVVLPDLPQAHWERLDRLQSRVKAELAERGLMLGQFHPACPEAAVRNPEFLVSRSPVPMLALRTMAFHDILFLDSDRRLFSAYAREFGRRFAGTSGIDPVFRSRYEAARKRFADPTE